MKNVLVTGSSRGIGKSIAEKFLACGFNVGINAHKNLEELNSTFKKFEAAYKNVLAIKANVSDYNQCVFMFDEFDKKFGPVDILINNAGISYLGLFNQMLPSQWKNILSVNFESVANCSHIAIQSMIKRKSGIIINISSVWGNVGASCETIYSASKGAVNLFTKSLAKELALCNIRVNAIACGMVNTQMNEKFSEQEKNDIKKEIPIGYFASGKNIADLAYFLSSDESSYITGQIINVDGGWI